MRFELLIDGYNLMHAAGLARERYAQGGLERARKRLLSLVRHGLTQEQRAQTIIVFDGQNSEGYDEQEHKSHGMRVIFSSPSQEADDVIEELIAFHSFPKQLKVISSDHRLHKAGRHRRAKVIDSEEFLTELERGLRKDSSKTPEIRSPPEKPVEVDSELWLQEFGEIDFAEIEQSLRQEEKQTEKEKRRANKITPKPQQTSPITDGFTDTDSKKKPSHVDDESEQAEELLQFDLEFWEKRIAELDQEE